MRKILDFDNGWHFHEGDIDVAAPVDKGPLYIGAKTERMHCGPASRYYNSEPNRHPANGSITPEHWEYVRLPHDFIIRQAPDPTRNCTLGYFDYHNAWYRKSFDFSPEDAGKRVTLEFDGVSTEATVWLNGCLITRNFSGYNSFEADVTDFVRSDFKNVLAVHVGTQHHEGWWYEGGGITRDVRLVITDAVSVGRYGVYVRPEKKEGGEWNLHLETTLVSVAPAQRRASLVTELIAPDGSVAAVAEGCAVVPPHGTATAVYETTVSDPLLWDVDAPNLYRVVTRVTADGGEEDTFETRTGFRTFFADPERGFFLNGRRVEIRGVCAHEDCGLLGKAVPANVHRYKAGLIREMGANAYRTSHYQQNDAILDAMDELGMIVWDEARWFSSSPEAVAQLENLIRRDRNRPSVFFWSLGNEEPFFSTEAGGRIAGTLAARVRALDPTRLVTAALSFSPLQSTVNGELDVIGINYNTKTVDEIHANCPGKPIISSENCATGTTRGWYDGDCPERGYISAYDHNSSADFLGREFTWKFITAREWIMGGFQWDAFEHRGETVWPRLCSQSGAIDLYLQKKDAFYQNQSHWLDRPMLHLMPHWNVDAEPGENVRVCVYTNCEEVTLTLNGRELGRFPVEKDTHLEVQIPYEEGKLEAIGRIGGAEAARDAVETSGAPARLVLTEDCPMTGAGDAAIVTCTVVDAAGRPCPSADPFVEFSTTPEGKILGTGSDVCDHSPLPEPCRRMRAGRIGVAVGAALKNGAPAAAHGAFVLTARAPGLRSAKLTVRY